MPGTLQFRALLLLGVLMSFTVGFGFFNHRLLTTFDGLSDHGAYFTRGYIGPMRCLYITFWKSRARYHWLNEINLGVTSADSIPLPINADPGPENSRRNLPKKYPAPV
mgnify:CR=1 FL=1